MVKQIVDIYPSANMTIIMIDSDFTNLYNEFAQVYLHDHRGREINPVMYRSDNKAADQPLAFF